MVSSCRLGSRRSSPSPPVGVLPAAVDAVAPVSSDGVPACQRSSQIIKIKGQKFESKLILGQVFFYKTLLKLKPPFLFSLCFYQHSSPSLQRKKFLFKMNKFTIVSWFKNQSIIQTILNLRMSCLVVACFLPFPPRGSSTRPCWWRRVYGGVWQRSAWCRHPRADAPTSLHTTTPTSQYIFSK